MAKNIAKKTFLPNPETIQLSVDVDVVNAIAIRRGKVRELMRMGYSVVAIQKILKKGIKLPDDKILEVDVHYETIKNDVKYIKQEMASADDGNLSETRAEILDKLHFLYERAINEYISAKGQTKNSFLNTALAVMSKIVDIEGVKSADKIDANLTSEGRMAMTADQLNKLGEDERKHILTTIRTVIEQRKRKGSGGSGVSNGTPGVPAQTSDNEGVSGESKVRSKAGRTKTIQQETTD